VVYEGSLPELIATTAGRYELRTTDDAYAAELAGRRPDIKEVERTENGITFATDQQVVAELTIALGMAGVGIHALQPRTATLEELFFRMTES
jgi:ABC-2 type transport system ATP-binding protein